MTILHLSFFLITQTPPACSSLLVNDSFIPLGKIESIRRKLSHFPPPNLPTYLPMAVFFVFPPVKLNELFLFSSKTILYPGPLPTSLESFCLILSLSCIISTFLVTS